MSDKSIPGSDQTGDSEASRYHSFPGSAASSQYVSLASSTSSEFASCFGSTADGGEEKGKSTAEKNSELKTSVEQMAELSDYDEQTDEFLGTPGPNQKFPGKLAAGEKWMKCPYYAGHFYICNRAATHLYNCRAKYLSEKKMEEKDADIAICKYDAMHHGPLAKLKKHELYCENGSIYFMYLDHYIERQRLSVCMAKKEAEKGKDGNGPRKEEDDKKKVEGGLDDDGKEKVEGGLGGDGKKMVGGGTDGDGKKAEGGLDGDGKKKVEGGKEDDADYHGDTEDAQEEDHSDEDDFDFY